jgi:hypothetical protein
VVWVRLDDAISENPKIARLSDSALALYVCGLAYCNRNLTDGDIPRSVGNGQLRWCGGDPGPAILELEEGGLWEKQNWGWTVHDYDQYQPSKAEVEAERAAARERKQKSRTKSRRDTPEVQLNSELGSTPPVPVPVPNPEPTNQELAPTSSSRKPDLLFEALCEATGQDWHELSRTGRKAANVAAADLRKVGATPDEILQRAENYRTHFGDAALTATALAKHWAQCAHPSSRASGPGEDTFREAMRLREEEQDAGQRSIGAGR